MIFREYIDKFKNGTLTDKEEEFVKKEIEKHEAITDYLYEKEEEEFSKVLVPEANSDEVKKVNKHVNKKILIKIIGSLLTIIILGFMINFCINKIYYNPNEGYIANGNGRFFIDTSAFTEESPDSRKFITGRVKELPKSSQVSAYFGFKNSLILKEFEEMCKKYTSIGYDYVAVETRKNFINDLDRMSGTEITGFKPESYDGIIVRENRVGNE